MHVDAYVFVYASPCVHFLSGVLINECYSVLVFPVCLCIHVNACVLPGACM